METEITPREKQQIMVARYHTLKIQQDEEEKELKQLRGEILLDFPVGMTACGAYAVVIKQRNSPPRVDWKALVEHLNGADCVAEAEAKAKDAPGKPSYVVEVVQVASKREETF